MIYFSLNFLLYRDLQQGGYPVINPRNETFPEHFNVKGRADVHFLTLKSDNVPAFYSVAQPQPGSWYAAVYLGDVDESMNVKVRIEMVVLLTLQVS